MRIIDAHIHCGNLNGGHERMSTFYDCPQVYFDTSVAPAEHIAGLLAAVGPEQVIFGSDVSGTRQPFFNFTRVELEKFMALDLDDASRALVLAENVERLVRRAEGVLE
jgi:predicted TIM-barrel fold metal-dependent hydrolase